MRDQIFTDSLEEVMSCYHGLRKHMNAYGDGGIGSLIVSMTRRPEDLFTVYLQAREAGLIFKEHGEMICPIPVVPLLETIADLQASSKILESFLAHPLTQASLEFQRKRDGAQKKTQQIMVGYSDSCKDGGILASQWNLNKAQKALQEVAERHGVEVCFFHGRGGTISRGAGPIHRFLQSLPKSTIQGQFRMTEQGETISQKYANFATAVHNIELLLANVTAETSLSSQWPETDGWFEELMDYISDESFSAYRQLVTERDFPEFFSQATPIDVLENTRIGSRPSKRSGKACIEDLRAIPWVFSWNQSRFYLPSWYGVGKALASLRLEHPRFYEKIHHQLDTYPLHT